LIDAALAVLDESGDPIDVTVRGVASRVGVAPTAVYLHFPHRDALLVEAVTTRFMDFVEALAAINASDLAPLERLRTGHRAYMDFARANPGVYRAMFGRVSLDPDHAELGDRMIGTAWPAFASLLQIVEACIEAGDLPPTVDRNAFARVLFACEHGWSDLVGTARGAVFPTPDDIVDTLLSLTGLSGAGRPPGASTSD
jgi:AcrR family transcriptional regulator